MYMHRRISTKGSKSIFVSRPRRFGKSLTISALKAFPQGRRELFEESLAFHVQDRLQESGFSYDGSRPPPENLGAAIKSLSVANGGTGVVILIDEYDAPVGHTLDNIEVGEAVRARLSALYSQMKNRTGDIRIMLMTGVSKFTKLSVFSALNNLVDLPWRSFEWGMLHNFL